MDCKHSSQNALQFLAEDYISGETLAACECSGCGHVYTDVSVVTAPVVDEVYYPPAYYGQHQLYNFLLRNILDPIAQRVAAEGTSDLSRLNG